MDIKEVSESIHKNNVEKGFWEDKANKNVGEVLMLCVSELSEALEAHRKGKFANQAEFLISEKAFKEKFVENIKDSFEDEIADTVIRLFDLCQGFDIDLEWHIQQKMKYNATREFKHGKAY